MAIKFQSAVIFVKDIAASRRFYEDVLGQNVAMDFGANVGFEAGFALWEVNHAHQMIFQRDADGAQPLGAKNMEIYFEAETLDEVWQKLQAAGVQAAHPIIEQPWGQRALRVYDPDGHIVEVGEPMPVVIARFAQQGMTAEAIAERTYMPLEVVRQIMAAVTAPPA